MKVLKETIVMIMIVILIIVRLEAVIEVILL